jgi:hypothetical protein
MLLQDAGELKGVFFKKDFGKTVSKTSKSDGKESKKVVKKVYKGVKKYALPIAKQGASLGLDIVEKPAPALSGLAGAAAATAVGRH